MIGGGDWAKDRIITDLMEAVSEGKKLCIRNPNATRPWQHVLEPLSGYLLLGQKLLEGKKDFAGAWNFDITFAKIAEWYRMFYENQQVITENQLKEYVADADKAEIVWTK